MSFSASEKISVGVLGASGYIGAELLRYLVAHPRVRLAWASAHSRAGDAVADVLPNLAGRVSLSFTSATEAESRLGEVDVVFLALPHNQSQDVIPRLAQQRPEVLFIDMAGDFRTNDPEGYRTYYGCEHRAPEALSGFVYGFTELSRERLRDARRVANPGCFATGMLLALAPLARAGHLGSAVSLTGITGSTGSGNKPSPTTHHPERFSNVRAYKVLRHQHLLEVGAFLRGLGSDVEISFVPQSGPFSRGIFTTVFVPDLGVEATRAIYREAYSGESLVHVVDGSPDLRWVQGSSLSFVGVDGTASSSVVFTAIDNLGKGAASQAIQNMNVALGIEETEGLQAPGGFV